MFKPNIRSVALACLLAGSLAGCDRGATGAAQDSQAQATPSSPTIKPGKIDRSHAGDPIPAITVTDPAGTTLKLAALTGKPVLLNMWATWCAPCVKEMPQLNELAGALKGKVRVITVSMDLTGAKAVNPFFARHDLANLPRWMDSDQQLVGAFGGGAVLPETVLYNARGKEVWRVVGGYDWGSKQAQAKVLEAASGSG